MPKTKKKFNWEVVDKTGSFIDILTMTRNEMKDYKKLHPDLILTELGYSEDDERSDTW